MRYESYGIKIGSIPLGSNLTVQLLDNSKRSDPVMIGTEKCIQCLLFFQFLMNSCFLYTNIIWLIKSNLKQKCFVTLIHVLPWMINLSNHLYDTQQFANVS